MTAPNPSVPGTQRTASNATLANSLGFFCYDSGVLVLDRCYSSVIIRVLTSSRGRAALAMTFQATGNVRVSCFACHWDHSMTHRSKNAPLENQGFSRLANLALALQCMLAERTRQAKAHDALSFAVRSIRGIRHGCRVG